MAIMAVNYKPQIARKSLAGTCKLACTRSKQNLPTRWLAHKILWKLTFVEMDNFQVVIVPTVLKISHSIIC